MNTSVLVLAAAILGLYLVTRLAPQACTQAILSLGRKLLGLKRRVIFVDGQRIVYLEGGRGEPLILLHGMGSDKDNFLHIAACLKRHCRLIIPDLPGFGESDRPSSADYSVDTQVSRLHAFVCQLGLTQVHLGGNSMGGFLASAYAARNPERVKSLWLMNPAGVKQGKHSALIKSLLKGEPPQILARSEREFRNVLKFVTHKTPYMPGFIIRAYALQQARDYDHYLTIIRQMLAGKWMDEQLAETPARRRKVPTLILWGKEDRAVDVSGADILHGLLLRSRTVVLPNVGHVPHIEAPRQSTLAYLQFLHENGFHTGPALAQQA